MTDLIAALEAAEAGSRELDVQIARAAGLLGIHEDDGEWFYALDMDDDSGPWLLIPNFSTSLDAAMLLVPEGRAINVLGQDEDGLWIATLRKQGQPISRDDNWPVSSGTCATPALALVIAALKAREA